MIHTHSGSPPSVRETLLRNLVANSSMAWLGQSVCVMGGTSWLWGLLSFGSSTYSNQPGGIAQTSQILHLGFSSIPTLLQVPPGPSKPCHLFPRTRSLGPSLGAFLCACFCVSHHTYVFFFPRVPCFIIILISVVLSFMLPLTFIFGLVMLFMCL